MHRFHNRDGQNQPEIEDTTYAVVGCPRELETLDLAREQRPEKCVLGLGHLIRLNELRVVSLEVGCKDQEV